MMTGLLPTQAYKGVRDFLPPEFIKKQYIFDKWRQVLIQNGFEQYETSLLESAQLYIAKSGDELGANQLYSFTDKGDRLVALRPEQTPSLARLVAGNLRQLKLPIKWFSIPNCFRYEQPQKGRYREHWQLNVDIIGSQAGMVEVEILLLLGQIFLAFGADRSQFRIDFNHRGLLDSWLYANDLSGYKNDIYKVLDSWYKLDDAGRGELLVNVPDKDRIFELANQKNKSWQDYLQLATQFEELDYLIQNLSFLQPDVDFCFNPCIIRGIAYYTGLVFEAFDKNPHNPRSLFGGGRYDNLLDLFTKSSQPAIGFGFGDATMHEFLLGHNLYPDFLTADHTRVDVGIMVLSKDSLYEIYHTLVPKLKTEGKSWLLDFDFDRNQNKRYESLKKRGCNQVVKV